MIFLVIYFAQMEIFDAENANNNIIAIPIAR